MKLKHRCEPYHKESKYFPSILSFLPLPQGGAWHRRAFGPREGLQLRVHTLYAQDPMVPMGHPMAFVGSIKNLSNKIKVLIFIFASLPFDSALDRLH
jgi:hypothetical protein